VQLFDVRGQPFEVGIRVDHALDVIHIQQVHFWPFWSADPTVLRWTVAHGTGIDSLRNDNPLLSELFFFGYATGIHLGQSDGSPTSGITSKAKVTQMDCDACLLGVHIDAQGTRGVLLSQLSTQGIKGDWGLGNAGVGVQIDASDTSLSLVQGDFAQLAANAVRVAGGNAVVTVSDTMVREWNSSEKGFPAFELVGGRAANPGSSLAIRGGATGEGHGAGANGDGVTLDGVLTGQPL
jgi:hypothetical protein